MNTLWKLPVPSTALLDGGVRFEKRLGREVALHFSYEQGEGEASHKSAIVFEAVEAFKCTYYRARDASMNEAYDRLVDRGPTAWLAEVSANLKQNGGQADRLEHLMINFDDGPCYEVLCLSFRVETG